VYLRPSDDTVTARDIPEDVLAECAQLVKANSIQGNKKNNVRIVYTPFPNLKKTRGMEAGQVGFYDEKERSYTRVETRMNEIVNRLKKTMVEKDTDVIRRMYSV
jgi:coiled-coil domain-containing protein 25